MPGFSEDIIDELLDRLGQGESLNAICGDKRMPSRKTIYQWARQNGDLAARIADARELGFHVYAEKTLELVEACEDPHRAKVILAARQWFLGKVSQRFAEKPVVGLAVNVDAGESFSAIANALESLAAAGEIGRASTFLVGDAEGTARPADAAGGLADMAGAGGARLGQNADRS